MDAQGEMGHGVRVLAQQSHQRVVEDLDLNVIDRDQVGLREDVVREPNVRAIVNHPGPHEVLGTVAVRERHHPREPAAGRGGVQPTMSHLRVLSCPSLTTGRDSGRD